jgi:hypothetical protein
MLAYLPEDVLLFVFEFIPIQIKYTVNKSNYFRYHEHIIFSPYDGYIRDIIRNDSDFIFQNILSLNIDKWKSKKKFLYKKVKCDTFIRLLNMWCIEYKSNKCRNQILCYL